MNNTYGKSSITFPTTALQRTRCISYSLLASSSKRMPCLFANSREVRSEMLVSAVSHSLYCSGNLSAIDRSSKVCMAFSSRVSDKTKALSFLFKLRVSCLAAFLVHLQQLLERNSSKRLTIEIITVNMSRNIDTCQKTLHSFPGQKTRNEDRWVD